MKNILLFSFLLYALILGACKKVIHGSGNIILQERSASNFTQLETSVDGSVNIVQGAEEKVVVETDDNLQAYVLVSTNDNILRISMQSKVNLDPTKMLITVYVKNISTLKASNNGDLNSQNQLISDSPFTLTNSSNGSLSLNIKTPSINCNNSANGNITLTGESQYTLISNSANGNFNCKDLLSNVLDITNTANGDVNVYAKDTISIEHKGNGNLYYYGDAYVKKMVAQGNGSVEHK